MEHIPGTVFTGSARPDTLVDRAVKARKRL